MKKLIVFIALLLVGASFTAPKTEPLMVYFYYNFEDSDLGSFVVVVASSEYMAEVMIKEELHRMGLTFEPTNIVERISLEETKNFVVYSDSGDR